MVPFQDSHRDLQRTILMLSLKMAMVTMMVMIIMMVLMGVMTVTMMLMVTMVCFNGDDKESG